MTKEAYNKIRNGLNEALYYAKTGQVKACYCVGPQNGDPMCPCAMRNRHDPQMFETILKFANKIIEQSNARLSGDRETV
jgi:hypothetical protein